MQFWNRGRLRDALGWALATLVTTSPAAAQEFAGREKLRAHGEQEFRKDIVTVADGVYVAVGYSMANVTLIVGDGGTIIVDTTSKVDDAQAVKAEFAKISSAPVRAIIYTHSHPDHAGGASVFAGTDRPRSTATNCSWTACPMWAALAATAGISSADPAGCVVHQRRHRHRVRASVGTRRDEDRSAPPTTTFRGDRLALTIAGVRLELLHTPGETNDGISVWLPATRVLLTGDLFLKAFPNLYAIRGAAPRPVMAWVGSLTGLIALGAEHVVPGHTRPVLGATNAGDALTAYRDGIKSVLDQTLEGMRKGQRPDELVAHVKLPPHLAESPYLQGYYGTVEWSVRAIYSDQLGGSTATPRTCSPCRRPNARRGSCPWPVESADVVTRQGGAGQEGSPMGRRACGLHPGRGRRQR